DKVPPFAPHEISKLASLKYNELALRIISPFVGDSINQADLKNIIDDSYKDFRHKAIAPLKQLGHNDFLLDLFHGPTLAFKDFALQLLGRTLEHFLKKSDKHLTVIGATSGDTGSAAIEGCMGRKNMQIFIMHPSGRVSDVQRRQMTTIAEKNVFNIALEGTFDDCQDIVKSLFADNEFRTKQNLTAVNSINWARILAQVVYYFYAALALGAPARKVSFCVPTGNFGDIYAGYIAKQMGLPIEKLIIATNKNDILKRCLETGKYSMNGVVPTISPSMDIQISSNFERLLFNLYDADAEKISELMDEFRAKKEITLSQNSWLKLKSEFSAGSSDDAQTKATIKRVYQESGELLDPHSAVGVAVARKFYSKEVPIVTLATAHPAKFPEAVESASKVHPALPPHLADLLTKEEKMTILPNEIAAVKKFIINNS
ncbi:MAG: threonine synthase, partial [Pseudomonadota bacterium]